MNKSLLVVGLVVVVLLGSLLYLYGKSSGNLGATLNYYSSLNQVRLYTTLESLLSDINKVRIPLAGISSVTGTWNPGSVATSTITNVTSTDVAVSGAVMGDLCLASLTSATSSAIDVKCDITGTATATISIVNLGTTNAAIDLGSGTYAIRLLPVATFAAPAALGTTSSTSN